MLSEGAYTPEAIRSWNTERREWVLSRLGKHNRDLTRKIKAMNKGRGSD